MCSTSLQTRDDSPFAALPNASSITTGYRLSGAEPYPGNGARHVSDEENQQCSGPPTSSWRVPEGWFRRHKLFDGNVPRSSPNLVLSNVLAVSARDVQRGQTPVFGRADCVGLTASG
jgi:hypothetical protein